MQIGNQTITRDMLPTMQAWMLNPDHLRQAFQDIFAMQNQAPVQPIAQEQKPTAEGGANQWNQ